MTVTPEPKSPSPPATPTIPIDEKKPAAVKAAVISGSVNIALMAVYFALVWYSNERGAGLPDAVVQAWCAVAILILLDTIAGSIFSIIVLAQHKRWRKAGIFGLIANGLPALMTFLFFILLRFIARGF